MSPHCTICNHDRQAHIDRLVLHGRSLLSASRECGVSYDALRRHVKNGHVAGWPLTRARPGPAAVPVATPAPAWESGHDGRGLPGEVWEFSGEEDALWAEVSEDWLALVASATGIAVADLRRCDSEGRGSGHADPCAACDAIDAAEPVERAMHDWRAALTPPEPGRWVSVEELEAEARDGRAPGAAAR